METSTNHRQKVSIIKYLLLVGLLCYVVYICSDRHTTFKAKTCSMSDTANLKRNSDGRNNNVRVLVWSSYFNKRESNATKLRKILGLGNLACRDWCEVVGDRTLINVSDVLVWHGWPKDVKPSEMPHCRNPNQPWVWWTREPVYLTTSGLKRFNGLFNWTMTYREDSDILYDYGHFTPLQIPRSKADREWLRREVPLHSKTKLVVGVMSDCGTPGKRHKIVELLRRHGLHVDIYGRCGTKVQESDSKFWKRLSREYTFYLAFENILCQDYVTEKLWRSLNLGIVPVVYGGANYTKLAPPNSFIDIRKFTSTRELVKFLKWLDNDLNAYAEFFEWRKSFRIFEGGQGFCNLCDRIREMRINTNKSLQGAGSFAVVTSNNLSFRHVYTDLFHWWTTVENKERGNQNGISKATSQKPACSNPEEEWFWDEI